MAQKWLKIAKMDQKLAPAKKIAEIYLQLFASLQKSCDNQINNGTVSVGWFSPGWLPLSDHPGQKTQRKILGFKPAQREAGFARPTDSSDRNNKQ